MNTPAIEPGAQPLFRSIPAVVLLLIAVIAAVTVWRWNAPVAQAIWMDNAFAVQVGTLTGRPDPLGAQVPYLLHVLLHAHVYHLVFNLLGILAFGAATARMLGRGLLAQGAFLVLFALTSIAGAVAQVMLSGTQESYIMIGASTGAFGLIAAATYKLASHRAHHTVWPWEPVYLLALAPWILINIAIAVWDYAMPSAQFRQAWAGHLGGLFAGAILFPVFLTFLRRRQAPLAD